MKSALTFSWTLTLTLWLFQIPILEAVSTPLQSPHIKSYETPIRKALVTIPHIEPSGLEGIDCLYVINLEKRPEKWQRMQTICKEYGLVPSRVNAIDGPKLPLISLMKLFGNYRMKMKRGAIGCLLSHVSVYLDCYQRQLNCVWICEDDVDFIENPLQIPALLNELSEIDPDWDILYTDTEFIVPACYRYKAPGSVICNTKTNFRPDQRGLPLKDYLRKELVNENFTRIGQRFGTYSYCVSKKGIEKLLNYFLHIYLWSAIDVDMHYTPGIRQYVLNRNVASHWLDSGFNDTEVR